MFRRVLIANRGEIAQRILRACRELGIETVVVYSEGDKDALYLRHANEAICIGPAQSARSYLDVPAIISAAEIADVEAIVPGYGFLAENAHFAEVCRSCNIHFVGPDPETIAMVGHKARAREMAIRAGVPVVPGSDGAVETETDASGASVTTAVDYMSNVEVVLPQWDYDGKSARAVLPRMELQRWGKNLVLEGRLDADVCPAPSTVDAD